MRGMAIQWLKDGISTDFDCKAIACSNCLLSLGDCCVAFAVEQLREAGAPVELLAPWLLSKLELPSTNDL